MGAQNPQQYEEEYCPSCGQYVPSLNDETGWCDPCSGITSSTHCNRCKAQLTATNGLCNKCKYIVWLETNADAIDRTMVEQSCSAARAKQLVLEQNRPKCVCCGKPIKGGNKNRSVFCTKTAKCRKAQNAYRYYRYQKYLSHEQALQRALEKATIFSLVDGTALRNRTH